MEKTRFAVLVTKVNRPAFMGIEEIILNFGLYLPTIRSAYVNVINRHLAGHLHRWGLK